MYGFEEDIEKSLSAIKKYHGGNKYGKKNQEISKLIAQNHIWYAKLFNLKKPFDYKLNHELEDGLKKYRQDQTKNIIQIDIAKEVNYDNWTITVDNNRYRIGKRCIKGVIE